LHHSRTTARAHATEEAVHPAAVAFLGLKGSFDGEIPCAWSRLEPR